MPESRTYQLITFLAILFALWMQSPYMFANGESNVVRDYSTAAIAFSVGPNFNIHTGSFLWPLDSDQPCGPYTSGSETGVSLSAWIELPSLFDSANIRPVFGIDLRGKSGTFEETHILPVSGGGTNPPEPTVFNHEFAPSMSEIVGSVGLSFSLGDDVLTGPMSIRPHIAFGSIIASDWTQTVTHELTNENTTSTGALDNTNSQWYVGALLTNSVEISESLGFIQNIQYQFALTDVVNAVDWQAHSLTFSLGIRGLLSTPTNESRQSPKIPFHTIPESKPIDSTQLAVVDTLSSSIEPVVKPTPETQVSIKTSIDSAWIEIGTELTSLYSLAIVNAVFFDSASSVIPASYVVTSDEVGRVETPLEAHNHVLYDLAQTMLSNPKARCELTGATSGRLEEPRDMANSRALAVKSVLVGFGVEANRIQTRARELPVNPSNSTFVEGREENRRVDIDLQNAPAVTYVSKRTFRRLLFAQSCKFTFAPAYDSITATVKMLDNSRAVTTDQDMVVHSGTKRLTQQQTEEHFWAEIKASDGKQAKDTIALDLRSLPQQIVENDLRRFRPLLRFNYNSSELTNEHKELLTQMVAAIPGVYNLVIRGTSDDLGTSERNEQLRKQRAQHVADFLQRIVPEGVSIRTESGPGQFEATSPAGRFLNRAIQILVLPQ